MCFLEWISHHDFADIMASDSLGVNEQVDSLLDCLERTMDLCFPLKTTWRREGDPPWINKAVKKLIRKRRKVYHREGRSDRWRYLKKRAADLIRERAEKYWDHQKRTLLQKDASWAFFKNAKAYQSREKPPQFDVRSLFEAGTSDKAAADKLADHFNGISREFSGISPEEIPETYSAPVPVLNVEQVATRLRVFRKPKSMVKYDIFPSLVTAAAPYLAAPLCKIYNNITTTGQWPSKWKEEFVTPIPKKAVPEGLDDLRNISCTALFSKVYESFVLEWMCEQIGMRENQMGGMKGAGTEHYLVLLWQQVLENLEDSRAASLLTSIDYSKAFNRLDFGHCLRALARKGASTEVIGIVASFLTSRTMAVKVGQAFSSPRIVLGGVPQGSILGVFLFNATIDSFEAGSKDVDRYRVIGGRQDLQPDPDPDEYDRSLDNKPAPAYNRPSFRAWRHEPLVVLKYVDDNIILEKVFFDGSAQGVEV